MRIGFDAKRAFYNKSGLGSYSRDTISILLEHFPSEDYFLYTPGLGKDGLFQPTGRFEIRKPENAFSTTFHTLWRTMLMRQLKRDRIGLYHGLSHELPAGTKKSGIKTVVTIHDLIFMRYPQFYYPTDRLIYKAKFNYSCEAADKIIAISKQTRDDLIQFLKVPSDKIEVVYQGCNPRYYRKLEQEEINRVRTKYGLPSRYILCVATLESRKNQAIILKALHEGKIDFPLVLAGKEKEYANDLKEYIASTGLKNVFFTGQVPAEDLPALYQGAQLFVYPSLFEGFGIPILEALNSGVPVITSGTGCFPEAGGPGTAYADVQNPAEMAAKIKLLLGDQTIRQQMIEAGFLHAREFREEKIAKNLMQVYKTVLE